MKFGIASKNWAVVLTDRFNVHGCRTYRQAVSFLRWNVVRDRACMTARVCHVQNTRFVRGFCAMCFRERIIRFTFSHS
jgi:hypothetical protein